MSKQINDKCDDSYFVLNLSTVDLSESEINLLSKGLSFCPTAQKSKIFLGDYAYRNVVTNSNCPITFQIQILLRSLNTILEEISKI